MQCLSQSSSVRSFSTTSSLAGSSFVTLSPSNSLATISSISKSTHTGTSRSIVSPRGSSATPPLYSVDDAEPRTERQSLESRDAPTECEQPRVGPLMPAPSLSEPSTGCEPTRPRLRYRARSVLDAQRVNALKAYSLVLKEINTLRITRKRLTATGRKQVNTLQDIVKGQIEEVKENKRAIQSAVNHYKTARERGLTHAKSPSDAHSEPPPDLLLDGVLGELESPDIPSELDHTSPVQELAIHYHLHGAPGATADQPAELPTMMPVELPAEVPRSFFISRKPVAVG